MNQPVIDVAIGLVFIYVLYSLLASTIGELIATIFTYRGKMLERGIEQMLDGANVKIRWWDRLKNFALYLKNKKQIEVPADKKDFAGISGDRSNVSKRFKRKAQLFSRNITDHVLFRRAAESGLSDKPSYLKADTFSDILIDVLHPDKSGPILLKNIRDNIHDLQANPLYTSKHSKDMLQMDAELADLLNIYIQQANGDVQRFRILIEQWYDDMMVRVGGWYKRQTNKVLIIIGFFLAVIFNVNTITIVSKLSEDDVARAAFVNHAIRFAEKYKDDPRLSSSVPAHSIDSTGKEIDSIKALYRDHIAEANTTLGLGWSDAYKNDSTRWATNPGLFYQQHYRVGYDQMFKTTRSNLSVFWYILLSMFGLVNIVGFLITAFAISLGAPFWFDLLNKFINLRVSGAKPEEKAGNAISKTTTVSQKPDPTAKG